MFEVTVLDAGGFTFTFTYDVKSASEARKEFMKRARQSGITKFKGIKVVNVKRVQD